MRSQKGRQAKRRLQLSGTLALAGSLLSPASATPPEPAPVVFIHGIKGARLAAPDGSIRWISALQALGLSTPSLALPMTWDPGTDGAQARDALTPNGILERIVFFPRLLAAEVYGPWLESASARLGRPFHAFAYDWRRENLETVAELERFLVEKGGGRPAHVVSHSMGGLVTLALLNARPELFASVTFAGTPFPGGVGFLLDLHAGTRTGFNPWIVGPAVLATFPSVYSLFPDGGESPLLEADGRSPISVDLFAAADWRRLGLGLFAASPPGGPDAFEAFLSRALARAREFRRRLADPAPGVARTWPPTLAVLSRAHPTLDRVVRGGPRSVRGWDFETAPREPGDGRVAARNALPPARLAARIEETSREHVDLLNDPAVIEAIRRHLDAAEAPR